MKKICALALAATLGLTLLASCGSKPAAEAEGKEEVVVLLNGNRGDKAFYDSAAHGVELMQAKQIPAKVVEMGYDETKWEPTLTDYAELKGANPIVVGTWQMNERLEKVAPEYPDKKFIIFDSSVDYAKAPDKYKNVYSIEYKQNECSYLAGMAAAYASKTGKVGFVGGMESFVINDFLLGYVEGARAVNPEIQILISYVGNYQDAARAKELALAQIGKGADVVYQVASTAGLGVIDACAEKGVWAIGVDSDQALALRDSDAKKAASILTSALKLIDNSIFQVVEATKAGKAQYGQTAHLGLKEEAVGIVYDENLTKGIGADKVEKIKKVEEEIKAGKVKVSSAFGLTSEQIAKIKADASKG